MNWLNKLERKFHKFAIPGLINYLVSLTGIVFALTYVTENTLFLEKISLNPDLILKGEVWRLVSYIFIPPSLSPFWIIFSLYFFYLVGTGLEQEWGAFKFNVYYFTGVIGTTAAGFISGGGEITYLSTSLFLAFAYIYPNFEILIFFILPVKIKYIALITWLFYIYDLTTAPLTIKISIIVAIINFLIFFSGDIIKDIKNRKSVSNNRHKFKTQKYGFQKYENDSVHKCTVCGRTEKDDAKLEFRYCSKCNGRHAYCSDHIFSHTHI